MLFIFPYPVEILRGLDELCGEVDEGDDARGKASGGNRIHRERLLSGAAPGKAVRKYVFFKKSDCFNVYPSKDAASGLI